MRKLSPNQDLSDDIIVIFRDTQCTLKEAIDNCKPGEPIEGIHPFQYDKLIKRFETERNKKFQYSSDLRYGDWRFILFDINKNNIDNPERYLNPKYFPSKYDIPVIVRPIPLNLN